jgi:hypothetical protein
MPKHTTHVEEHELPCIEAVLAGTLALMTGYSQTVQAELGPQHRLRLGAKVADNLSLLADHPQLSAGFRQVLLGLRGRWQAMCACTAQAAHDCECHAPTGVPVRREAAAFACLAAPKRLQ